MIGGSLAAMEILGLNKIRLQRFDWIRTWRVQSSIEEPSAQTGAATSVRSAQNQEPDVRVAIALNLPLSLDSARHRIPEISEELAGHTHEDGLLLG